MPQLPYTEMLLAHEITLLDSIKLLNDNEGRRVVEFIHNSRCLELSWQYRVNLQKQDPDMGFNLFELISDHYYRETFHSDILYGLLNPRGKHRGERKYLQIFLEFIVSHGVAINAADYTDAEVKTEQGRIDLLIFDERSKKAVIIENKINNAIDQWKQLPRYLAYVEELGYTCDAIIYLRLNGYAGPDTMGWTDRERKRIKRKLKVICAYEDSETDLLNGWIRKCEKAALENQDAQHVLRQYGALIKKLGGNVMNKQVMQKFYEIVVKEDNLKTALSLKAMVDDLILYRVERIIDRFKNDLSPFHKVNNYANNDAYFTDLFWNDAHLGLDIVVEPESYLFQFWDRNDRAGVKGNAKSVLKEMGCLHEYTCVKDGLFGKVFAFPSQEEQLIEHIVSFKRKLGKAVMGRESRKNA